MRNANVLKNRGCEVSTFEPKAVLLAVDFWSKSSATFDTKAVLLLVYFWSKSSAAFYQFYHKKQHCFWPIFTAKAVLLLVDFWNKSSTAFVQFLNQKLLQFLQSSINQSINQSMNLYLWCLWSNLGMWYHFLHLQNLRNSIKTSARITERGIAL